ncbi:hypothetical protein TGGT1_409030 [Toxoplasma gondii GT1]|uniref:Uncharacterized protein n=1 Tax=Toxoplasma gondii (strain ATCC 50853 / GT1) TaxID=507601 RepID=S7UXL8_TOXGG|nr:hypothetical protein TGGT1_409030 [Toxoplasma gondii GT1]
MNETSALLRTRCQGREAPCIDQGFQHLCLHASYTPVVTCACMDTCTRAKEGGTATVYVVLSTEIFVVFFCRLSCVDCMLLAFRSPAAKSSRVTLRGKDSLSSRWRHCVVSFYATKSSGFCLCVPTRVLQCR